MVARNGHRQSPILAARPCVGHGEARQAHRRPLLVRLVPAYDTSFAGAAAGPADLPAWNPGVGFDSQSGSRVGSPTTVPLWEEASLRSDQRLLLEKGRAGIPIRCRMTWRSPPLDVARSPPGHQCSGAAGFPTNVRRRPLGGVVENLFEVEGSAEDVVHG